MIDPLQFDEVRDCRMHAAILTHSSIRLCQNRPGT